MRHWGKYPILRAGALTVLSLLAMVSAPLARAADGTYRILHDSWTEADERGYGEFITAIGENGCNSVNKCLHSTAILLRRPIRLTRNSFPIARTSLITCVPTTPGSAACRSPTSSP